MRKYLSCGHQIIAVLGKVINLEDKLYKRMGNWK